MKSALIAFLYVKARPVTQIRPDDWTKDEKRLKGSNFGQ